MPWGALLIQSRVVYSGSRGQRSPGSLNYSVNRGYSLSFHVTAALLEYGLALAIEDLSLPIGTRWTEFEK